MHPIAIRLVAALALLFTAAAQPARAVTLIRDAEIEYALDQLAAPVLRAAGLSPDRVQVLLIHDRTMNAFVIGNDAIFIHTGLVLQLDSAAQLQAVIAHEAAHIANGHITRRMTNMRMAQNGAGFGLALAIAVAAAGGEADAVAGIAVGSAQSAQRRFFAHTRAEEASADQASIRYLLSAGVPTAGAVEVLQIFRGQEALSVDRQDPYARTHPLTTDRLRALQALVSANPGTPRDTEAAAYWFARAQGKLSAFIRAPGWTLREVRGRTDAVSVMRAAVAYHRQPDPDRAIATMRAVVNAAPDDAFYHDLYGQILLEKRQTSAAVQAFARAADLAPNEPLILGGYGRALLALDTDAGNARAVQVLEQARARDDRDARILRDLGQAYARTGQPGQASLAVAERYALIGRMEDAALHAGRAADQLPRGSAPWQRAQDVLSAARQQ